MEITNTKHRSMRPLCTRAHEKLAIPLTPKLPRRAIAICRHKQKNICPLMISKDKCVRERRLRLEDMQAAPKYGILGDRLSRDSRTTDYQNFGRD